VSPPTDAPVPGPSRQVENETAQRRANPPSAPGPDSLETDAGALEEVPEPALENEDEDELEQDLNAFDPQSDNVYHKSPFDKAMEIKDGPSDLKSTARRVAHRKVIAFGLEDHMFEVC